MLMAFDFTFLQGLGMQAMRFLGVTLTQVEADARKIQTAIKEFNADLKQSAFDNLKLVNSYERLAKKQKLSNKEQNQFNDILDKINAKYPKLLQSAEEWSETLGKDVKPEDVLGLNIAKIKERFLKDLKDVDVEVDLLFSDAFYKFSGELPAGVKEKVKEGFETYKKFVEGIYKRGGISTEAIETIRKTIITEDEPETPVATEKKKETAFQKAKRQYDLDIRHEKAVLKLAEAEKKETLAKEGKTKSTQDEIDSQVELIKVQKSTLEQAQEILDKELFTKEEVAKGTKQTFETLITDLEAQLKDAETKGITLKTKLELEEDEIKKSIEAGEFKELEFKLGLKEISKEQFLKVLNEVLKEAKDKVDESNNELRKMRLTDTEDMTEDELKKYEEQLKIYNDYVTAFNELTTKKKEHSETELTEEEKARLKANKNIENIVNQFMSLMEQTAHDAGANQKAMGKALLLGMIDIVQNQILIWSARVMGEEIASKGWAGIFSGAALVGLLTSIVSGYLKGAISGAEEGTVVGEGQTKAPGSTDVYPHLLAKHERVFSAKQSLQQKGLFTHIAAGGEPLDYYTKSFAMGSTLLSSPTPAMIGDNPRFAEAALLEPQIESLGAAGGVAAVASLKGHLEMMVNLQALTNKNIVDLNTRFYVLEKDIAEGTNRHNNKVERRIRT